MTPKPTHDSEPVSTGLLIGGELRSAERRQRIEVRNPAWPGAVVGSAAAASPADTEAAIEAAAKAFRPWAGLSYDERAEQLVRAASGLSEGVEERARLLVRENGKVLREALIEMVRFAERFEYTASLANQLAGDVTYPGPPLETTVTHQAMGVVALIVPWNWPLSILGAKLPQALMAGNTVVVKPPSLAPLATVQTLAIVARLLPPGVINVITGTPVDVAGPLLEHPAVRMVDLTGGVETVGR